MRPDRGICSRDSKALPIVCLIFVWIGAAGASIAPAKSVVPSDVGLSVSNRNLILLDYAPGEPLLVPGCDGGGHEALTLPGAEVMGSPGAPGLPVRRVALGVPHGAAITLRVLNTSGRSLGSHRLLPVPRWEHSADGAPLGRAFYEEDPTVYGSDIPIPDAAARIVLDSVFRGQRVVVVELAPFRYRPLSGELELLGPMTVALDLAGGAAGDADGGVDLHDSWLERQLVNYESARSWRKLPARGGMRKAPGGFDAGTEWYKLGITEKGMYRVTGAMLAGVGLDIGSVDPSGIRVFNGGGRQLPEELDYSRVNEGWMSECAVWVRDGGLPGVFDPDDEIVFYGLGAQGWASDYDGRYGDGTWWRNAYTDTNVYWLTPAGSFGDSPRRMATRRRGWDSATVTERTVSARWVREEENRIENFELPYEDGWMWSGFDNATNERLFMVNLEDVDETQDSRITVRMVGQRKTGARHEATVSANLVPLITQSWWSDGYVDLEAPAGLNEGPNTIGIEVATSDTAEVAAVQLAWINIRYSRLLRLGDQVSIVSPGAAGVVEYEIELDEEQEVYVFDVTEHLSPVRLDSVHMSGLTAAFRDSARADSTFRYLATAEFASPVFLRMDETSDLRTNKAETDLLLIYHPLFEDAAQALAAHRSLELRVRTVKIQDVYDEFAWGLFDPVAIRDFLAYASDNYGPKGKAGPGYALLLGDASYNYRAEGSLTIPNYVPSWHGRYKRGPENIYSTDDWYGYLDRDDDEDDLMDIAIGRLPVQTAEEARAVVDKIIAYDASPDLSPWRARAVVAADDLGKQCDFKPCEITHTVDADSLAERYLPSQFTLNKIYLTEYPYVTCRKPGAQEDFRAALDEGAVITLFIGHGDKSKLADEELYVWRSSEAPVNRRRPTFFLAGSCDVADFAHPTGSSLGENLLRQPQSGAVSVLSSTYLAFSFYNYRLLRAFFSFLFPDRAIDDRTLGESLRDGKNQVRVLGLEGARPYHNERIELLGDPSQTLGAPRLSVRLSAAHGDSLQFVRRDSAVVHGQVMEEGSAAVWFNGTAWLEAFGTADTSGHWTIDHTGDTLTNCTRRHVDYRLPGRVLYRGEVSVEAGVFDARFWVPQDAEAGGLARLTAYVADGGTDGVGVVDSLHIGGMAATDDMEGPSLAIFKGHDVIGEGSVVDPEGTLRFCFEDESGINIQGLSDTSEVLLIIDNSEFIELTEDCVYEPGSFREVCAEYPYVLEMGSHRLEVRAMDNMGNQSRLVVNVEVAPEGPLTLTRVSVYPNPFEGGTYVLYDLSRDADVTIRVFTVSGRLIRSLEPGYQPRGQQQIFWDGRDEDMDEVANGAYIVKVDARSEGGRISALTKAMRIR